MEQREAVGGTLVVGGGFAGSYVARLMGKRGATILSTENFMLFVDEGAAAEEVDSSMLGRAHEPCTWVFRNAGLRPLFKGDDQSVLRELFGEAHVSDDASQPGNQAG